MRNQRVAGNEVARAVVLGQQHTIQTGNHDLFQIVARHAGFQRVQTHIHTHLARATGELANGVGHHLAGLLLHGGGHRIFQVKNDAISTFGDGLFGQSLFVAGDKQNRTHGLHIRIPKLSCASQLINHT
ncbi:hypothetical protein SDC9_153592 [bioreactor metagenome]|uniref:Uncharacterized protein n=1 Tax=bioreactor metagenome TaxID=1076179 RepID=A0A645EY39_9ZZZZ